MCELGRTRCLQSATLQTTGEYVSESLYDCFCITGTKQLQCKIESIWYFDSNVIQKPDGEDPICLWATKAPHSADIEKQTTIHSHILTQSQWKKQREEENMQNPLREASGS